MNNYTEGIDVSYYQKVIDWPKVIASEIKFAFIRVSDGGFFDPKFKQNWEESKGLIRGAYQYFRPNQNVRRQAELMLKSAPDSDLPLVLDLETTDGANPGAYFQGVIDWLNIVEEETKRQPIVYTRASFWNKIGCGLQGDLWVAHYTDRPTPFLPLAWRTWTFWQYTSTGTVPGISVPVDRNRFNGTLEQLKERYQI